jgi:hypothetical protein
MTDRPTAVPVRPGERSTTAFRVTFALGLFIAVAIIKPWGESVPKPAGESGVVSPPTAGASGRVAEISDASVEPAAAAATSCLSSDAEQLVVVERWPGNEVRSWIAVEQVPASGPLDPALTSIDVFAAHAVGIGVCAPTDVGARSTVPVGSNRGGGHAAVIVDVQAISSDAATAAPIDLGAPAELARLGTGVDGVRLYRLPLPTSTHGAPSTGAAGSGGLPNTASARPSPLPSDAATEAVWALGGYAIAFEFPFDSPGARRWLRFTLVRGGGSG